MANPVYLFQLSRLCAKSDIHHQRGGGGTSPVQKTHQNQRWLRQRGQFTETVVCRYHASNPTLDTPGAKLESNAIANGDTFWRQSEKTCCALESNCDTEF